MTGRVLLYDSGCAPCAGAAADIEKEGITRDRLQLRSLREPEMQHLLNQVRPGWKWEPTLLEVADDGSARVWTGTRMVVPLVQTVGIRRAQMIARLVNERTRPEGSTISRRSALTKIGAVVAAVPLLSLGVSSRADAQGLVRGGAQPPATSLEAVWESPEYKELRPRIVGKAGCSGSGPYPVDGPTEFKVEAGHLGTIQTSRGELSVLAFILTAAAAQELLPYLVLSPMAFFYLLDGEVIRVTTLEPDIERGRSFRRGIGRSASEVARSEIDLSPANRDAIERAKRRSRSALALPDAGRTSLALVDDDARARGEVVTSLTGGCAPGWMCCEWRCIEYPGFSECLPQCYFCCEDIFCGCGGCMDDCLTTCETWECAWCSNIC